MPSVQEQAEAVPTSGAELCQLTFQQPRTVLLLLRADVSRTAVLSTSDGQHQKVPEGAQQHTQPRIRNCAQLALLLPQDYWTDQTPHNLTSCSRPAHVWHVLIDGFLSWLPFFLDSEPTRAQS